MALRLRLGVSAIVSAVLAVGVVLVWFATPFLSGSFIRYSKPVLTGAFPAPLFLAENVDDKYCG